jgi:DNA-binding LacI/PurR family transcriptional regulator
MEKDLHLYQVIANDIQGLLASGDVDYDQPICTEKSLCEKYNVSRITAKRALSELEAMGLLYRKRSQGSFAVRPSDNLSGPYALQNAPHKVFALLVPFGVSNGGIFRAIESASSLFSRMNCQLTLHISEQNVSRERDLLNQLYRQNVDGLVYYPWTSAIPDDVLLLFVKAGKPVIVLDKDCRNPEISTISCDNYAGSRMLAEHLLMYGHRNICYLSRFTPEELSSVSGRYKGYADCLKENAPEYSPRFVRWEPSGSDEYPMLKHIVSSLSREGISAIMCENDEVAFNVYMCCRSLGLRVPGDISITGFDNIDWATTGSAQITTVDQNFTLIGETIADTLLQSVYTPQKFTLPVKLVPRTSTGKSTLL